MANYGDLSSFLLAPTSCLPAAKFTRSGTITIGGGTSEDGKRVFLSVADTGLGIPSDKFSQIFGAFEQVDMSTTRSYGGTGLGLHLVKQLVEAHNGVKAKVLNIRIPQDFKKPCLPPCRRDSN